jgi:sterol desaturase/sphingolipid hydroxylase (fatty acid hydroxylase superfamily)
MLETIQNSEPAFRISFFLGVLVVVALWELVAPRRGNMHSRWTRWPSNLGIMALNTVMLRLISPIAAVTIATSASTYSWGLFNQLELTLWLEVFLAIILLDAAIYFQHRLFHAVPILWKTHRMHHTDIDFDVTTGVRFHPLEIILSALIKLSVVLTLGASPIAVIFFEILLNATAMFNHGNVRLPIVVDGILRLFIVTPDMHRVHHSVIASETDSNFGFNLPWWDHLFGTYLAQPEEGHTGMTIGINGFRKPIDHRLDKMLMQPLKDDDRANAIQVSRKSNIDKKQEI